MVNKRIRQSESARKTKMDIGRTEMTNDSRQTRERKIMVPISNPELERILACGPEIVNNVLEICTSDEPDPVLLRYVLDRILPRSASDAYLKERVSLGIGPLEQIDNVIQLVCEQKLTPGEGAKMAQLIDQRIKVQQHIEIMQRLETIERAQAKAGEQSAALQLLKSRIIEIEATQSRDKS